MSADECLVIDFSRYKEPWENKAVENGDDDWDTESLPAEPTLIPTWRDQAFELEVAKRKRMIRIDNAARTEIDAEEREPFEMPDVQEADEFLMQEDPEVPFTIYDLWPAGGNVLFAAAAKTGKSTTMMNLLRSLCDGTAFLDVFGTQRLEDGEKILFVDLEMSESRVRSELRAQHIERRPLPILVANLRGKTKSFDITDPEAVEKWTTYCRKHNVKVLILDPLAPLLGYLNVEENDNTTVNRFFQQLDAFKNEAGIRDMIVTHHCGHGADMRPRGASRFNDWPDALWLAKIQGDITDPDSPRKFFVRGRDVGESFRAAATIRRDETNEKKLFLDMSTAAVSDTENLTATEILQIVSHEPLPFDSNAANADTILSKLKVIVESSAFELSTMLPINKLKTLVKKLVEDRKLCDKHTVPTATKPARAYQDRSTCGCTGD